MKKDDFMGTTFPDTDDCYSAPMDEYEVKYLLLRNASYGLLKALITQQAKQIADVLLPLALTAADYYKFPSQHAKGLEIPDLQTTEGVESFFDEALCKEIAEFVRKGASK